MTSSGSSVAGCRRVPGVRTCCVGTRCNGRGSRLDTGKYGPRDGQIVHSSPVRLDPRVHADRSGVYLVYLLSGGNLLLGRQASSGGRVVAEILWEGFCENTRYTRYRPLWNNLDPQNGAARAVPGGVPADPEPTRYTRYTVSPRIRAETRPLACYGGCCSTRAVPLGPGQALSTDERSHREDPHGSDDRRRQQHRTSR